MSVDCTYEGNYSSPANYYGVCVAQYGAPVDCPLYFVTASQLDVSKVVIRVYRDNVEQTATGTITLVDTSVEQLATVDTFSCTCDRYMAGVEMHRYSADVPGLAPGDYVSFDIRDAAMTGSALGSVGDAQNNFITIEPAGACAPVEWPTSFTNSVTCDRCPEPEPQEEEDGGCMAGGALPGLLVACVLLGVMRRR